MHSIRTFHIKQITVEAKILIDRSRCQKCLYSNGKNQNGVPIGRLEFEKNQALKNKLKVE